MEFPNILHKCIKNGIKVYPIWKNKKAYIQANVNGKKKTFDKSLSGKKEINEAITKTYIFYYNKLIK